MMFAELPLSNGAPAIRGRTRRILLLRAAAFTAAPPVMVAAILCDRQTRAAHQGENSHRNQKIAHEHAFLPTPSNTAARQKFRLFAPRRCYGRRR